MNMPTPPITREAVFRTLYEYGPMTAQEISDTTGIKRGKIDGAINKAKPHGIFYIKAWRRQPPGTKGAISPVYDIGNKRNAPKPDRLDSKERNARYREQNKALIRLRCAKRRNPQSLVNPFAQLIHSVL